MNQKKETIKNIYEAYASILEMVDPLMETCGSLSLALESAHGMGIPTDEISSALSVYCHLSALAEGLMEGGAAIEALRKLESAVKSAPEKWTDYYLEARS